MKVNYNYLVLLLFTFYSGFSQIGIGTTTPAAALDVTSATNGVLIPRIALSATNVSAPVVNPQGGGLVAGTLVYNTATAGVSPNNVIPGFYYWNGAVWISVSGSSTNHWALTGNGGTTAGTNYVGTTDAQDIRFKTAGADRFNIHNATGQFSSFNLGSATSPTYSWNADLNTGMYSTGPDAIAFATNGTQRMRFLNNGQIVINNTAAPFGGDQFAVYSTGSAINAYTSGPYGVYSQTTAAGGFGLYAYSTGANSYGAFTYSAGTAGVGTYGAAQSATGYGIWGRNGDVLGTGVTGSGNNQTSWYLNAGSGGAFTGTTSALYGRFLTGGVGEAATFQDSFAAQWLVGYWSGAQYYKIIGNGAVSTIVDGLNNDKVVMHCPETPENLFQDFGQAKLVNGRAHIEIDPILAKNILVDAQHPIKIFVQPEGECNGVYIANKSANSFDVIELQSGSSNISFSYSIIANRANEVYTSETGQTRIANYDQRFEKAPEFKTASEAKQEIPKAKSN
ncbi:MAG: hypothetical protein EOO51_10050 [Flavobacterium sp.]|nr:MAG: hypothetical protein EOO51_10050 [Flavobacterium sp.]